MATGEVSAHVLAGKAVTLTRIQTSCQADSSLTVASIKQSVLGGGGESSVGVHAFQPGTEAEGRGRKDVQVRS